MGEIVNLRNERRKRDRDHAATDAAANRSRFGRTRAEKHADARQAERQEAVLDGARLEADNGAAAVDEPANEE